MHRGSTNRRARDLLGFARVAGFVVSGGMQVVEMQTKHATAAPRSGSPLSNLGLAPREVLPQLTMRWDDPQYTTVSTLDLSRYK